MSRRARLACIAFALFGTALGYLLFRRPASDLATPRLIEFLRPAARVDTAALENPLRVAVASLPSRREKDANLAAIAGLTRAAKVDHSDLALMVFGESSLGLYHASAAPVEYQRSIAEPIPGPATDTLGRIAASERVHLAVGLVEREGDRLYNAMVVFDTAGRIIAKHRKMMLHWLDQLGGLTEAEPNAQTVTIGNLTFGLSICADANSPWLVAKYRNLGIDALIYSVTSDVPAPSRWLRTWPYGRVYDAWILAANRSGTEGEESYPGTVFIAAPNGRIQASVSTAEGYLSALIGRISGSTGAPQRSSLEPNR